MFFFRKLIKSLNHHLYHAQLPRVFFFLADSINKCLLKNNLQTQSDFDELFKTFSAKHDDERELIEIKWQELISQIF